MKFHTKYLTHPLKDVYFIHTWNENLRALRFIIHPPVDAFTLSPRHTSTVQGDGQCPLKKGGNFHWAFERLKISTSHMSPQTIAGYPESTADGVFLNLYLDQPITKGDTSQSRTMSQTSQSPTAAGLTHLPLNKMAAISQTTFSNAFSWMKSFIFWFEFHWCTFLRV